MKPEPQLYYTVERCQRFKANSLNWQTLLSARCKYKMFTAKCMVQAVTRSLKQKLQNFDLLLVVNDKTHNFGTFWCSEHGVKPGGLHA